MGQRRFLYVIHFREWFYDCIIQLHYAIENTIKLFTFKNFCKHQFLFAFRLSRKIKVLVKFFLPVRTHRLSCFCGTREAFNIQSILLKFWLSNTKHTKCNSSLNRQSFHRKSDWTTLWNSTENKFYLNHCRKYKKCIKVTNTKSSTISIIAMLISILQKRSET